MLLGSEAFLEALARGCDADARMMLCGFPGDPGAQEPTAWRPRPWRPGAAHTLPLTWNGYVTVASFRRASDGSWRRRSELFAGGHALMVDDVGTKVPRAVVEALPPTARVETSPGNEQWWYMLEAPERDAARFDALIRAFVAGKLLGNDPGMSGVTRVGRIPGHLNGKAAYGGGFVTQLLAMDTGRRFTVGELLESFRLELRGRRSTFADTPKLATEEALERNRAFATVYGWLGARGMLKRAEPDMSGWTEMRCPWRDEHTGGVDNGAALREPAPENDFYGAFRCHHGHCADKGWSDLTEWVAEESAAELAAAAQEPQQ